MYYPDILNLPQTGFNAKEKSMIIKPTELIGTVGFLDKFKMYWVANTNCIKVSMIDRNLNC